MEYKQIIRYDINIKDVNKIKNRFGYNNWENHVDKGKYPCYNSLHTIVFCQCKPVDKIRLTRSIANNILKDKSILQYMYQYIYNCIKDKSYDEPLTYNFPYKNNENTDVHIDNYIEGNMIRFDICAANFNNRQDILNELFKIINKKEININK